MRVADAALPIGIELDAVPMVSHWPVRPVFALDTGMPAAYWDNTGQNWDGPNVYWDGGWTDATCAWTGAEIDTGEPDDSGLFPAARLVLQLDNASGQWSTLNADGTTNRYGPGTALAAWAHRPGDPDRLFGESTFGDGVLGSGGGDWWLFNGFVSRYDQRVDNTIEIEAFDAFSDLAMPIGTFTPGANGNKPGARLTAILAAAGRSSMPHIFSVGVVGLTAQETDASPLEEMQAVSLSDGGVLLVDADGTLLWIDRAWPAGRDDQLSVPVISANVCSAEYVVWDMVISSNDDSLADQVVLENKAELKSVAGTSGGYVMALNEMQWTTQAEGDILAEFLLEQQEPRQMSVEEFTLYLNDPNQPDMWRAVDWRRIDHLRFLHDQRVVGGGTLRVDVTAVLDSILHEINPEGWTMTVSTAKVRAFTEPIFYDDGVLYDDGEGYGY